MIEQLKTIREALELTVRIHEFGDHANFEAKKAAGKALTALTQLEAMVGEQEPVAFVNGAALSRLKNGESVPAYNCWGSPWPTPLYAAPVVQQPQADKPLAALQPKSSYVQPVPDHCDRIVWRNNYYHLPLKQPQAEAVPWAQDDLDGMVEALWRVIEIHYNTKQPFHNPVYADARMAHRVLVGYLPYMKYVAITQQKGNQ